MKHKRVAVGFGGAIHEDEYHSEVVIRGDDDDIHRLHSSDISFRPSLDSLNISPDPKLRVPRVVGLSEREKM